MGDESGTSVSRETGPLRVVLSNVALLATIFAFVTVAIRALVVARLDPTTAVALVQTSGPVNVFVGTLTTQLPPFLLAVVYGVGFLQYRRPDPPKPLHVNFVVGAVVLIYLVAAPYIYTVALVAIGSQFVGLMGLPEGARVRPWLALAAVSVTATFAGGMFFFSPSLWLPQEVLAIEGEDAVVGYVLEDEGRWVTVLEESNRELKLVEETKLTSRRPCATAGSLFGPSVVQLVMDLVGEAPARPNYSDCS